MTMALGLRRTRIALRVLISAALAFAGIAKLIRPEEFAVLRLFGGLEGDPIWISYAVSVLEIATAAALLTGVRVGPVLAVALTSCFVVYHVGFGLGLQAPTCGCWGFPTPKRASGVIAVALLLASLLLLVNARAKGTDRQAHEA